MRSFTPPEHIKATAQAVLNLLEGLTLEDSAYVLDLALNGLERARQQLLSRQLFSPESCTPTDSAGRPL